MRNFKVVVLLLCVAVAGLTACSGQSSSPEDYPQKTVKLIVPWPAGGSTDIIARGISDVAGAQFGQPVVVENREGGAGTIGTQAAANTEGDGYTILVAAIAPTILQPYYVDLNYTPESFKGVAQVSTRDVVVAVKADAPWDSLEDLAESAGEKPGEITYAVTQGVHNHLLFEMFNRKAGIKTKHFPVQGDSPSITAVLSGTADITVVSSVGVIKPYLDSGEMKALGVFSEERVSVLPDVPTAREQGYDVVGNPWTGLLVPKATPDELVQVISDKFGKVIRSPEFAEHMDKVGETVNYLDKDEYMNKVMKDYRDMGEMIEVLGLGKQ